MDEVRESREILLCEDYCENNILFTFNFFSTANSLAVAVSRSVLACDNACLFGITSQ